MAVEDPIITMGRSRRRDTQGEARNLRGVFIDTAVSAASELRVLVEDFSERESFGPVIWTPLRGPSGWMLPAAGDVAWISEFRGVDRSVWVVTAWTPSVLPSEPGNRPVVTALPGSPVDGDEVYFQSVAMEPDGVVWHLRYRAGSASAYKWEMLGGSPLANEVTAAQTRANAAYGDLATVGPAIALPLAGDYIVDIGASIVNDTAAANTWMSYAIGATAAVDADSIAQVRNANTTVNTRRSDMRSRRKIGLAVVTLTAKYRNDAGTSTFENRWMAVRPVRVG